jgi:hypothetical protein
MYFLVSLRERRNPAAENNRKKAKKATPYGSFSTA